MKLLLLWTLGLLGVAGAVRGQKLRGAYGTPDSVKSFDKYFIRFDEQHFFYLHAGCLGTYEGSGTFRWVRNHLESHFEHSAADTTELIMRPGQPGDPTTTFRFRVQMKLDGRYAGASNVLVASRAAHKAVRTDENGEAVFRYDAPVADTLDVGDAPAWQVSVPVQAAHNRCFTVRLYQPVRYLTAGTTIKLRIVSQTAQALSLRELLYVDEDTKPQYNRFKIYRLSATEAAQFLQQ